jgi:uncharacterized damage-inducible protein DinB
VVEAKAGEQALDGAIDFKNTPAAPATLWDVIATCERTHQAFVERIGKTPEAELHKTVKFFVAPKQMGDVRTMGVRWCMPHDCIHHRDQLSVYLRLADGKVSSIYGPAADEPWM